MTKLKEIIEPKERVDYTGKNIYVGLDVHKKNWYATEYVEQQYIKTFHLESSRAKSYRSFLRTITLIDHIESIIGITPISSREDRYY